MLRYKDPFEYELSPETLSRGTHWVALTLKNMGDQPLDQLDVRLHPMDTLRISIDDPEEYVSGLSPRESRVLSFWVNAEGSTSLYVSASGRKGGGYFYWDSPWMTAKVVGERAELERVLVSNPYGNIGKELEVEATIKGLSKETDGLDLEFWADSPSGKYVELAEIKPKKLSNEEESSYTAKITPKEPGVLHDIRQPLR